MKAMTLPQPSADASGALIELPEPCPGEVLIRVELCGVCRTDLHGVEAELSPQGQA
jgi:propanol-preferring alcohol dehydrogenase